MSTRRPVAAVGGSPPLRLGRPKCPRRRRVAAEAGSGRDVAAGGTLGGADPRRTRRATGRAPAAGVRRTRPRGRRRVAAARLAPGWPAGPGGCSPRRWCGRGGRAPAGAAAGRGGRGATRRAGRRGRPRPGGRRDPRRPDLRTAACPAAVPGGSARQPAVLGRVVAGPVRRGEALTDARLVGPGLTAGLDPQESAAVPVRLADAEAAALVRPGDRVDVLGTPVEPDAAGGVPVPRPGVSIGASGCSPSCAATRPTACCWSSRRRRPPPVGWPARRPDSDSPSRCDRHRDRYSSRDRAGGQATEEESGHDQGFPRLHHARQRGRARGGGRHRHGVRRAGERSSATPSSSRWSR